MSIEKRRKDDLKWTNWKTLVTSFPLYLTKITMRTLFTDLSLRYCNDIEETAVQSSQGTTLVSLDYKIVFKFSEEINP